MICGGTPEYPENNTHFVELGRNLSPEDVRVGRRVVVLGFAIADRLFPFIDPIGKTVKVDGRKFTVAGVFAEKKSALGGNFDNYVLMPITVYEKQYGSRDRGGRERSINITVRARSPELLDEAMEQTRAVLRNVRGLSPRDPDNFFFFTSDSQIKAFNQASAGIKTGAFVLGIVALVVAGIGIMNIMLVSVTERTREIGIRKALGAKRRAILVQFLLEAVILCNIGGLIGVAVGFGLGNLVAVFTEFEVHVPLEWAVIGLLFCTVVGLVAGMWPATAGVTPAAHRRAAAGVAGTGGRVPRRAGQANLAAGNRYLSVIAFFSSPGSDFMYDFHPGQKLACHRHTRPRMDVGFWSYLARKEHVAHPDSLIGTSSFSEYGARGGNRQGKPTAEPGRGIPMEPYASTALITTIVMSSLSRNPRQHR